MAGARAQDTAVSESTRPADQSVYGRLQAIEAELAQLRQHQQLSSPTSEMTQVVCGTCGSQSCGGACGATPFWHAFANDKFPTVDVTGFFHLDAAYYDQSERNRATLGDIEDGLGFRRARLAAKGKVTENTAYVMEFDFAQAQARLVDVWLEFQRTPLGNLRIGRYRQPFGMSELTSIRELTFIERPLQFALVPFRQTGVMLYDTAMDETATWAISGYRYASDNFGNVYSDTGGYGLATRLTTLAIDRGDQGLVHFGLDYSFNDPGRDSVQYASSNEFFVGENPAPGSGGLSVLPIVSVPAFVSTGPMDVQHTNLANVEAAMSWGRLVLQSEARWAFVENLDGTSNTFPGAYAHVRYMLTGETIPYNRAAGVFDRVQPLRPVSWTRGCWGAWELAARISHLDLNGDGLPGPGRRLTDSTVGLNWYVNAYTKFQLNWIHAELDDPARGDSNAETYALRGQLDF